MGDPLLRPLLESAASEDGKVVIGGRPALDASLRLRKDMEVFVMGDLAALQVGPDAANLSGGLKAARIVVDELRQHRPVRNEGFETLHELNNPYDLLAESSDDSDSGGDEGH
jgi:hypothetical protein